MIDQQTIQRIFDTADIVEVVGEFVSLKKAGQNFKGLSPFANEKTPSFMVSPSKGIFKDFSSGKGGNVVTFLMEHEKLSYPEALKFLAKKYNIEIVEKEQTPEEVERHNERESLMAVTSYAGKTFVEFLHSHQEGIAVGLSYLKERGIRSETIKKFEIGYSPEKRDSFTSKALENGYKLDFLTKTGLTIQKGDYKFDRFFNRVIFPIHSLSGKVIGFGGRVLKKEEKTAKYLNSPESDIYHKSEVLYGLYFAKQAIIKSEKCYIVEGYTDVISMHQVGIENVVASSGTALTVQQIRLVKRFTTNITILFDGDAAGIKASLRGIDMVLEEGMNVKVVLLPDGEDPDSYSKNHSTEEFETFIQNNEKDFITFKTKLLLGDTKDDPVKKANAITDIVRSISVIPNGITRTVYTRESSRLLDVNEEVIVTEIAKFRGKRIQDKAKRDDYNKKREEQAKPKEEVPTVVYQEDINEKEIIRLLLNYGNNELYRIRDKEKLEEKIITVKDFIVEEIQKDELEFINPLYSKFFSMFNENASEVTENFYTQHPDENISRMSVELLTTNYELSKIWTKKDSFVETEDMLLKEIVPETIVSLKNKRLNAMLNDAYRQLQAALESDNLEEVRDIQQRVVILNQVKQELSKSLGNRIVM
jgi:DNA primase